MVQIDAAGLNAQIEEKQEREQQEKERDRFYGALTGRSFHMRLTSPRAEEQTQRHAQMITDQVLQRERDKRREAQELTFYRKEQDREKRSRDVAVRVRCRGPPFLLRDVSLLCGTHIRRATWLRTRRTTHSS